MHAYVGARVLEAFEPVPAQALRAAIYMHTHMHMLAHAPARALRAAIYMHTHMHMLMLGCTCTSSARRSPP